MLLFSFFDQLLFFTPILTDNNSSKIKSSRKRSQDLAVITAREPPYDDHDDGGLQTIFSMYYAGFDLGTVNIFRKMIGLSEAAYSKQEDDKSYLHSSSTNIHQHHNSNQSNLSDFMT